MSGPNVNVLRQFMVVADEYYENASFEDDEGFQKEINIHVAAMFGDIDQIRSRLIEGVNINEKDVCGKTALDYAIDCYQHKAKEFLLSMGATITTENDQ